MSYSKQFLCFNNSRIKGKDFASKINLSPPAASAADCSKAVVLFINCLMLLTLFVGACLVMQC